ncbi:hypothetical protein K2173_017656 [Erythroxylum novogranatense]|uniref:Serine aminopeptidase S33 domain-containing protein n=1 Tax=Erythroxylum novogranatense TaxID=1862640 RepID=A0AAV8T1N2_9ROSI|nr:hypothetical protein K2173_017656 [Erythroxylum novogranatense]
MASFVTSHISPCYLTSSKLNKIQFRVRVECSGSSDPKALSSDCLAINETSKSRVEERLMKDVISKDLKPLWDDGYGTKTIKDYLEGAMDIIRPDGGPPRWFCPVECGQPVKDAPLLLFLPGIDGVGLSLSLHHKALGKVFEVQSLHIPVYDQTPFEGLLKLVEETVRLEHASSPNKPIYIVGESFGGCLALAVAARHPEIDLVLVLVNPATSFGRSQLQPLVPILEDLPDNLYSLLGFVTGNPLKIATVDIQNTLPLRLQLEKLVGNLNYLRTSPIGLADIIPKATIRWKLKMLKSAARCSNSRLHAVNAEVLVLASGRDAMLPSAKEAKRLKHSLRNCTVRYFRNNGHALLLEDSVGLLAIIKGTRKYRRSRTVDYVSDFVPPSMSEFKRGLDIIGCLRIFSVPLLWKTTAMCCDLAGCQFTIFLKQWPVTLKNWLQFYFYLADIVCLLISETDITFTWKFRPLRSAVGSVMFSTLEDGKIVKGLAGVPGEGPVVIVGYHMLLGMEVFPLGEAFLREKNIMIRGLAHPELFTRRYEKYFSHFSVLDWLRVMGAVPVTASNLFKLLSKKSHVLLYPGGAREALHYKGEEYKVTWPDQQEFVRIAARFGATIIPFGAVGEDDVMKMVLDGRELMKIPMVGNLIREVRRDIVKARDESKGEVANPELFVPVVLPKLPGRYYYLFGKSIETKGREKILQDKEQAGQLYKQIKSEIECNIHYLLKKRKEDPYRNSIDRRVYQALHSPLHEVPAFDP